MMRRLLAAVLSGLVGVTSTIAQPPPPRPVQPQRQPPPPAPAADSPRRDRTDVAGEPLTHGPIHEAFAAPTVRQPQAPQSVAELPPEPPEEVVPAIAPEQTAESARWIPGYWGWDARDQPRGYIFARGYWDVPLEERGILFAPMATQGRAITRVAPSVVIEIRQALAHWFVAPSYQHYCFGDYYDANPRGGGIVSWYERSAPAFDSLRIYYAKHNQQRFAALKAKHAQCQANVAYRPAHSWREYAPRGGERIAFAISSDRLPAGIVRREVTGSQLGAMLEHYLGLAGSRADFERGSFIEAGRQPVFAQFDSIAPPGHGGLPPGQVKKGTLPPGFGGIPPGQAKKMIESFGPIYEKGPKHKEKFGGPGGGKGKGKGK